MPRHAPELECSAEDKASLVAITKSRIEEARVVERARIILACLDGKEIQQVAWELGASIPTVSKWRRRFALWGLRGLGDQSRSGKPVRYDTAFRNRVLALLEELAPSTPALCSHGDVIPEVMGLLVRSDVIVEGPNGNNKGSWWEITHDGDRFTTARWHPPA